MSGAIYATMFHTRAGIPCAALRLSHRVKGVTFMVTPFMFYCLTATRLIFARFFMAIEIYIYININGTISLCVSFVL